ncbi:MAG: hypothetical protein F6K21_27650 [Symploca sp. SIO2D2]|nr:hypothetical protein [Symploca sp. SIO2D2]
MLLANPHTLFRDLSAILFASLLISTVSHATPTAIPDGEVDEAYSFTIVIDWGEGNDPPEDLTFTSSDLPAGLSINQSSGEISGSPTTAGDFVSTITLSYEGESNNLEVSLTIAPKSGTPVIDSASLSVGTVGLAYSFTLTATESPTSFNIEPSDLPGGVSANSSTGVISGTPTESGTFAVTVSANNAVGTGGETTHTITISPAGDLPEISSSATLDGDADELITYQIVANNDPLEYSASNLPLGVSINTETGFISGTPTIENTYIVTLRARNEFGWSEDFTLTITIGDLPQISNTLTLELTADVEMDEFTVTASNNPTTFSVNPLPTGLSFDSSTKKITGTPTTPGTTNVTIYAINGIGQGPSETLVITVVSQELPTPAPDWRPADFSVSEVSGSTYLFLHFEQSADDLSNFDYFIETSSDLDAESWTSVALNDPSLEVETTDNGDSTTSVKVRFPQAFGTTPQYMRYQVQAKAP